MSQFPKDDPQLTAFLKRHRPAVPPAAADLEHRIMTLVVNTPPAVTPTKSEKRVYSRRVAWFVPPAIAAGLVAIVSYQALFPSQPTEAELAELETFIENTWQGTIAEQPATETENLYPLMEESAVN